jgi:phosphate transport system substrate-binding protein
MLRLFLVFILSFMFVSCSHNDSEETTTKGNLHLYLTESTSPALIDEVHAFLDLYKEYGANITYTVVSENAALKHFIEDTSRILFLTRPLSPAEKENAKNINGDLIETIIAYDGIVAVVHPKNPLTQLTTTEIKHILSGAARRWNDLPNGKKINGEIKIYLQDSSEMSAYLTNRLHILLAAKYLNPSSEIQTLNSVLHDPLGIGFVTPAWLDSTKSAAKVLELGRTREDTDTSFAPQDKTDGKYFSPHPAYIYRNDYPLKRAIYMYTYTVGDLANGFSAFVASAQGQKILLQRGILPGTKKIHLRIPGSDE